jgi:hypothetical protein
MKHNDMPSSSAPDHKKSVLGWGGVVIGSDGIGHPMAEAEALEHAIPKFVDAPEHMEDAVAIYIHVMSRPEVAIRKAAITAIGAIVSRYAWLPLESRARQTVKEALEDSSADVSAAARTTSDIIRDVLGS